MATTFPYYLLPGEDRDEYEALAAAYHDEFAPETEHELFLVHQLLEARWKIQRYERLQAEALNQMLASAPDQHSDTALVAALQAGSPAFEKLQRFIAQAGRAFHRAHRDLLLLRRDSRRQEVQATHARIDAVLTQPLPNEPDYPGWPESLLPRELRNEPNPPRPRLAPSPASAILDSSWHEPGSQSR